MQKNKNNSTQKTIQIILMIIIFINIAFITFIVAFVKVQKTYIYPLKYTAEIENSSKEFGVEKALILATIKEESSFNERAKSSKGAVGLMQITLSTANYIAKEINVKEYDLLNPETNIRFGTFYLSYLKNKFNDIKTTICAYNAGEGVVSEWLKDENKSKDGKTLMVVPYRETENYLNKILKSYKKYKKLYPNIVDK